MKDNDKGNKTAKVIMKIIIKKNINMKIIKTCYSITNKHIMIYMKTIRSEKHEQGLLCRGAMKSIKYHSAVLMIKDIYNIE